MAAPQAEAAPPEVSVVMPCLNEAETLAQCIGAAQQVMREQGIAGEIIVADNGSTDASRDIAESVGAKVVTVLDKGYGSALRGGIAAARGRFIVMGDADASYDFTHIPRFLEQLRAGQDLVMGNRFQGGIEPGAMPKLHRYVGNPVLSWLGRVFFANSCGDFHCGLRGFSRQAFDRMDLHTTGMELASEMVVKASLFGMKIAEVPTTLSPDGRTRRPHLRTWRDGWRHLRFMLLYSPRWLFLFPGVALSVAGCAALLWLLPGPRRIGSVVFDVHTMLYAAMAVLMGCQAVAFAIFSKVFAISEGLLPEDPRLNAMFRVINLEKGLALGAVLFLVGLAGSIAAVSLWGERHFGPMDYSSTMRIIIPSSLAMVLGIQTVFCSFFLSILGLQRK